MKVINSICDACPIRICRGRRVDVMSLVIQPSTCKDEKDHGKRECPGLR